MRNALQVVVRAMLIVMTASATVATAQPRPLPRPRPLPGPAAEEQAPALRAPSWAKAEIVFAGTLKAVKRGPVGMSMPPLHTHTLTFEVTKVLRGSLRAGQEVVCSHSARQVEAPTFPEGKLCVVAAKKAQGHTQVLTIEPADEKKIMEVSDQTSLPLGWTYKEGSALQAVSPWAGLGKQAWAAESAPKAALACQTTGRPALLAGEGITFTVEPVKPKKEIQWTNPDGDGEYKITVTNDNDKALEVPALLSDEQGKVLWEQSLVILCQDKPYACPGFTPVKGKVAATRLEPKASVSTVVNALRLEGPDWPQGGYRIEFQFCLGEKSQTKSFYFMTRHHGPIREALKKPAQKGQ